MSGLFAFDDREVIALADAHRTPFFAYSGAAAGAAYRRLRAALPERATIAYAVKSNPHPRLLAAFAKLGASFDTASIGELERVRALELERGRTYFAGPGKRAAEVGSAIESGVRIQAESIEDLEKIARIATEPVSVNLRVHPLGGVAESNRIIGGTGPSAFGIDEETLEETVAAARAFTNVRIRGVHVFAASNERSAERLLATHAMVFSIARRLEAAVGAPLEEIDVGGGLGVPYAEGETELDVQVLGRGLKDLLARESWFRGRLILEPGRYLSAQCGIYVARVVRTKISRGERFAILEGGINHLLRPHLTGQPFPVRAPGRSGPLCATTLAGPLCTSLDRLGKVDLPALEPGDLVAFGTAGAYGFTEGMTHFLSHPVPEEVFVAD